MTKETTKPKRSKPQPAPAGETVSDIRRELQSSTDESGPDRTAKRASETGKKKRGRPRGSKAKPKPLTVEPPDVSALASFVKQPFALIAVRRDIPGWALSEGEAQSMAQALHAVILKYGPTTGPEVALAIVAVGTIAPRIWLDYETTRQRKRESKTDGKNPDARNKSVDSMATSSKGGGPSGSFSPA